MLKFLFAIVILIHGLVHLLGFVKEWGLARVKELTGKTLIPLTGYWPKIFGMFWLLGFLLFLISAVGLVLSKQQ